MTGYTTQQVEDALTIKETIYNFSEFCMGSKSKEVISPQLEAITWAASKYLEAKKVIEWYGDENNYGCEQPCCADDYCRCCPERSEACKESGEKAREYLEKLNQNKGEFL